MRIFINDGGLKQNKKIIKYFDKQDRQTSRMWVACTINAMKYPVLLLGNLIPTQTNDLIYNIRVRNVL